MTVRILSTVFAVATAASLVFGSVVAAPLIVPFDFSRGAIGLDATISGQHVFVMLDTGVDPSVVEITHADSFGVKVDRGAGGEAAGYGEAKSARVFPATIEGLAIASREIGPIEALAADTSATSEAYGRKVDVVLGYSFLKDRIVLIDYAGRKIALLDRRDDAKVMLRGCSQRWISALQFLNGDNTPIIADFRFGSSLGPISLDTGFNGGIGLFERALELPGLRSVLVENGEVKFAGARGFGKSKTYVLNESVGFGPFSLPAGETVKLMKSSDANDKRVANMGNALFAAMNLKILLDYRTKQLLFYGSCSEK